MLLTPAQYAMLCRFEYGACHVFFRAAAEDDIVRFLLGSGLICSDAQKGENYYVITQKGLQVKKITEEHAKREKRKRSQQKFDNFFTVANFVVALVSFVVGVIAEHQVGIVRLIAALFGS